MTAQPTNSQTNRWKNYLVFVVNIYVFILVIYLILRLILPAETWWLHLLNNFTPLYFLPLLFLLPLMMMIRATASAVRILLLLLIGALWFGGIFLPKSKLIASESRVNINITTFNVHANNRPFEKILLWIEAQEADIISLQEVRDALPLPDNAIQLENEEPYIRGRYTTSTVLLTDFPVIEAQYIDLDRLNSRNNIRAVLDIDGQEVVVYALHLTYPSAGQPRVRLPRFASGILHIINRYDVTLRNQQLDNLVALLEQETRPFLVIGDLNTSEFDYQYNKLSAVMSDAFRETNSGFGMTFHTLIPILRLDYIWHDEHFQAVSSFVGDSAGSDHYSLHATLNLLSAKNE